MADFVEVQMFDFLKPKSVDLYDLITGVERELFDRTLDNLKRQLEQSQFDLSVVPASYFLLGYLRNHLSESFTGMIYDDGSSLSTELTYIPLACERIGLTQAAEGIASMAAILKHNGQSYVGIGKNLDGIPYTSQPINITPRDQRDYELGWTVGCSDYLHILMQQLGGDKYVECNNLLRWLRCQELDFEDFSGLDNWDFYRQRKSQVEDLMKQCGYKLPFDAGMV